MDLDINDNGVLIVGGAKGIGHAIGLEFAKEGTDVVLADIDPQVTEVASIMAETATGRISGVVLDATDYQAVKQLASNIQEHTDRLNHIVYAAGVGSNKYGFPFWEMEPADWPFVLEVNLMGAVNVARFRPSHATMWRRLIVIHCIHCCPNGIADRSAIQCSKSGYC